MGSGRGRNRRANAHNANAGAGSDNEYVNFGDIARDRCDEQAQYVSRYVHGREQSEFIRGVPNLGQGLRFLGNAEDYHSLRIHGDDADEFVRRYQKYAAAVAAGQIEAINQLMWEIDTKT